MEKNDELELPNWGIYIPNEIDYDSNCERQDLLCRFKLYQVYHNFCLARMNYIFADNDNNYGDLDDDGKNKDMLEKLFLQNALLYYNFCIDISWSMIYSYYISKNESDFNISNKKIEEFEEQVNFENLKEYLTYQSDIVNGGEKGNLEKLINIVSDFWYKKLPANFRQKYNYIKHRGVLDIFGINESEPKLFFYQGHNIDIDIFKVDNFNVTEFREILFEFHKVFIEYMNTIIEILVIPHYKKSECTFKELLENIINNSSEK